uniref:AlNc14C351G10906 protein n=1 Tax=Albugo laibachii Nc14 TaxID=890382 RepID=F0WXF5_9STRA|nr:AlNc14C351G10906 [Albugo laibachii Nc14]|eukprot:CCA26147.1 AlNc14C351G10906 [Albugo laibachii Nc14]
MCQESIISAGDATPSSRENGTFSIAGRSNEVINHESNFSRDWNQRQVADKISFQLDEPKRGLIFRVVNALGKKKAWDLLIETKNDHACEQPDSMEVSTTDPQHVQTGKPLKRTLGGVFLSKVKKSVSKEVYKKIYEIEVKRKKEWRQKNRLRKRQQMDEKISDLKFQVKCAIDPSLGTGGLSRPQEGSSLHQI